MLSAENKGLPPSHHRRRVVEFGEGRLGMKLVLALVESKPAVVVESVEAWCACNWLQANDILQAVNSEKVECADDAHFAALVARIATSERPILLTFERRRRPRTDAKALEEYERRCENDLDGKAAYNASILRARGLGCEKDDVAAALLLLRKSASLGVPRAQIQLANLYASGKGGVKTDHDEAFRWYSEAATHNEPEALYELGNIYAERGAPDADRPDQSEALWCYFRASKLGHEKARLAAEGIVQQRNKKSSLDNVARWAAPYLPTSLREKLQYKLPGNEIVERSEGSVDDPSMLLGEGVDPLLMPRTNQEEEEEDQNQDEKKEERVMAAAAGDHALRHHQRPTYDIVAPANDTTYVPPQLPDDEEEQRQNPFRDLRGEV